MLTPRALRKLSYFFIIILSVVDYIAIASKGYSVLFMFLFADLLCCAAAFTIFYGMFNKNISKKLGFFCNNWLDIRFSFISKSNF